jgi:hypothetical protein
LLVVVESKISAAKRERERPNFMEPTEIPSSRACEGRISSFPLFRLLNTNLIEKKLTTGNERVATILMFLMSWLCEFEEDTCKDTRRQVVVVPCVGFPTRVLVAMTRDRHRGHRVSMFFI